MQIGLNIFTYMRQSKVFICQNWTEIDQKLNDNKRSNTLFRINVFVLKLNHLILIDIFCSFHHDNEPRLAWFCLLCRACSSNSSRWTLYLFVLFSPPGVRTQSGSSRVFSPTRQVTFLGGGERFCDGPGSDATPRGLFSCIILPLEGTTGSTTRPKTLKVGPHCLLSPILMAHKLECRLQKGIRRCCVSWG